MKFFQLFLFVSVLIFPENGLCQNQDSVAVRLAAQINADALMDHVFILADDEYEGRETGTSGQQKAAKYLAEQFAQMGIAPLDSAGSYFQPFRYQDNRWRRLMITVAGNKYRNFHDLYAYPSKNKSQEKIKAEEIAFLGYGIESEKYNDYKGVKVKNKIILILAGEPRDSKGLSLITSNMDTSEWSKNVDLKLAVARKYGAKLVLILDQAFDANLSQNRSKLLGSRLQMISPEQKPDKLINYIYISPALAEDIIGADSSLIARVLSRRAAGKRIRKAGFERNITIQMKQRDKVLNGENVLGFIEGSDDSLKNEVVILSAHYDHLGIRGNSVYNGADDNASGTAGILEIAKVLNNAKKQKIGAKRSVLCLLVAGEEKGLLGSKYYAAFPEFPLQNTIANLNVDMIGRTDKKHVDRPGYIYVIGSDRISTHLHDINERMNHTFTQLELDYTYNKIDDPNRYYYRSDHYSFAEKGIPAIFYFNGTHEDYHRETDTVEKLDYQKMVPITRLIFHTAWNLANQSGRLRIDKKD